MILLIAGVLLVEELELSYGEPFLTVGFLRLPGRRSRWASAYYAAGGQARTSEVAAGRRAGRRRPRRRSTSAPRP